MSNNLAQRSWEIAGITYNSLQVVKGARSFALEGRHSARWRAHAVLRVGGIHKGIFQPIESVGLYTIVVTYWWEVSMSVSLRRWRAWVGLPFVYSE